MDYLQQLNKRNPKHGTIKMNKVKTKSKKDALCNHINFPEKTVHKNMWNIFSIYPKP